MSNSSRKDTHCTACLLFKCSTATKYRIAAQACKFFLLQALVRNNDPETLEKVPRACEVVVADLGDEVSLKQAVIGCNKIIFCATARTSVTVDLQRVDNQGVVNLSKAFLVRWETAIPGMDNAHILIPRCRAAIPILTLPTTSGWTTYLKEAQHLMTHDLFPACTFSARRITTTSLLRSEQVVAARAKHSCSG